MEEPSLLDYLKERLDLRRIFHGEVAVPREEPTPKTPEEDKEKTPVTIQFPWRLLLVLLLALLGQRFFEPEASQPALGIVFYAFAIGLLILLLVKKEWRLLPVKPDAAEQFSLTYRRTPLLFFDTLD